MSDYANSKYAFGECRMSTQQKKPQVFMWAEKNVSNGTEIQVLLEATLWSSHQRLL